MVSSSDDAGGQRFITRYLSDGDLNLMEERPSSKGMVFKWAIFVRGTCVAKKENILMVQKFAREVIDERVD